MITILPDSAKTEITVLIQYYSVNDIDEIGTDTYGFESFVLLKGDHIIGFFINKMFAESSYSKAIGQFYDLKN